jgi:hypothetical protein
MKYKLGDIIQSDIMALNNAEAIITSIVDGMYIFDTGDMTHPILLIDGSTHLHKIGNILKRVLENL